MQSIERERFASLTAPRRPSMGKTRRIDALALRELVLRPVVHDFRDAELVPTGFIIAPRAELAPVVQGLVSCAFAEGAVAAHHMYRLPEPVAWLLVAGGPGGRLAMRVIGPRTRIEVDPFPAWTNQMCAVLFRPGAAGPVLGVPAIEIADHAFELEDVWGPEASTLRALLEEVPTNAERLIVLEHMLLARARAGRVLQTPCVQIATAISQSREALRLGDLERVGGWSQRQLRRHFERDIGLAPKRYLMLLRFNALLDRLKFLRVPDWAELAQDLGYCDQSHLITDFRAFTGASPTRFLADPMAARALRHGAMPRARASHEAGSAA